MKPLTIYDYDDIKEYLDLADYEGYNSNFVTMMMWNHEYHIEYEIHKNFLVMLHRYKNEQFWAMPFTSKDHYKEAIDYMLDYSKRHGFTFKLDCAIKSFVEDLKDIYKDKFLYIRTEYNDDYIYDKNMHLTLSGKKMQKRRNHYNAFLKEYPHYEYKEINFTKDFNEVLKCISKWGTNKEELSESIISEVYGIMYLFSYRELLNIKAGGIYINNQLEAFIIASPLNHKTIQIIIEKANKDIRGLYPAILKEFLERNFKDYEYINREEDMGLENLIKSKRSLHPVKMIEKYQIVENDIKIDNAKSEDINDLKKIWLNVFSDETQKSADFYFENCFDMNNTFILKNNNEIISSLQIVPYQMKINNKEEECYFILGVFTKKEYERQGLMKKLMTYILSEDKYKNKKIYLQAYNPKIYESFKFYPSHYHYLYKPNYNDYINMEKCNIIVDYNESILKELYQTYTINFDEYRIRDINYYKWLIKRTKSFDQKILLFEYNKKIEGYVIFSLNNELYVNEIIYTNQEALNRIISSLFTIHSNVIIETDLKCRIFGSKKEIVTMLSNYKNQDYLNKYINEVY